MHYTREDMDKEQSRPMPSVVSADLSGKTVIVTGANVGIGLEAAKHFARMNPSKLIIACRSQEKGEDAKKEIVKDTNCQNVEPWILELSNFASVKAFADRAEAELDRIDYLIENAGVAVAGKYSATEDGWETILQVNDLAPTLLALRLLPKMMETAKKYATFPRLVVVSSNTHYWSTIEKEILDAPKGKLLELFSSQEYCSRDPAILRNRYQDSKLFNVLFVRALTARLPFPSPNGDPPTITPVAINPGFCISSLRRGFVGEEHRERREIFEKMEKEIAFTAEEGSRQLVYGALGGRDGDDTKQEDVEKKMRGGYVIMSELAEVSDFVLSEDGKKLEGRIWASSSYFTHIYDLLIEVSIGRRCGDIE
ncbi:hypothetical protein VKT23_010064 [Stygiomarasmius scandens]|uniref:Short-chain dehydrogenase n=1 Tax=Marasmiellus scandens TaxID=2682957 RepID=A0ABR1JIT9_9AGAR